MAEKLPQFLENIMKAFRIAAIFAVVLLAGLVSTASAQEKADNPTLAPGKYSGHVTEIEGTRQSDYELDIRKTPGTIMVYKAIPVCRSTRIDVVENRGGLLRLIAKEGVILGCERSFELQMSPDGNGLTGTMTSSGKKFNATLKMAE